MTKTDNIIGTTETAPHPARIRYRLIIPFAILFAVVTGLSWFFYNSIVFHFLQRQINGQMEQISTLLTRTGFVRNPAVLRHLRTIIGGDLILFDQKETVLGHSLPPDSPLSLEDCVAILARERGRLQIGDTIVVSSGGDDYRVLRQAMDLPDSGPVYLTLWQPMAAEQALRGQIRLATGLLSLVGILAMAVLGYHIARTITRPIEDLAAVTEKVAAGDFLARAAVTTRDETGRLAQSFNSMIAKLRQSEAKLIASERLATAGQMAAGLAHEVRNPLTSIKMFVQVLQNRLGGDPRQVELIGKLLAEINRLEQIVSDIVNRSRTDTLHVETAVITELTAGVLELGSEQLRQAGIIIDWRPDSDIPQVMCDPAKIKQVFWNLLVNAREAMVGGGTLTVTCRYDHQQGLVEVLFEDTGPGFPEDPELLFSPSGRSCAFPGARDTSSVRSVGRFCAIPGVRDTSSVRSVVSSKPEGLGMGLAISRRIMELHGGELRLENRPEGGARAIVRLPIRVG